MQFVLTTCCRDKSSATRPLPAIKRYLAPRIMDVYKISKRQSLPMIILSGMYGILRPEDPIPYYDLRLEAKHVQGMARKTTEQMRKLDIDEIDFYGLDPAVHPDWSPYYDVIISSCRRLDISLNIIYLNEQQYGDE